MTNLEIKRQGKICVTASARIVCRQSDVAINVMTMTVFLFIVADVKSYPRGPS